MNVKRILDNQKTRTDVGIRKQMSPLLFLQELLIIEIDAVRVLAQERDKKKKIKESRRDVGIWKQLMLWNLLQNWSWLSPSDSEEVGGGKEKGGPKASDKKSATRNQSNKERKATKRLGEEYEGKD
ncbi:hypothetical protein V5799_026805 [Amblyomma americanum]|uniref:Uncharacterized protein n=1 Tax=Amblyomma americanum TaxID=6943 RepID=A0AAQ4DHI6_AMBAM